MRSWNKRPSQMAFMTVLLLILLVGCTARPAAQPTGVDQKQDSQSGQVTVLSTFTTDDFSGPGRCATCHISLKDEAGADVSMPNTWRSTMMANAAKDPLWQAKVSSEVERLPQLKAAIEKKCTTCHMPMAKTQAVRNGQPVAALGDGFYDPDHPLHLAAIDGVSCTLCHQVQAENLGLMASFSGGYLVDTSTNPPDRPIFGPYQQPVTQQMQGMSGFTPTYSAHMEKAEHCGTCHNLYTPYVDAQGKVLGEFPEQTPYTEWQHSQSAAENKTCQTCHMPKAQGGVVISIIPGQLAAREPFYKHIFVGGNAFMTKMLADRSTELSVTADPQHLEATQARVRDQISNQTAQLTLESLLVDGKTLTAKLQLTAQTGHKFPTSFPNRRAWLHVTLSDAAGRVVFESGQPRADGTIAGNAADENADGAAYAYEPHYDVITQADQVQIYEPIMGDNEGKVTYTLLRAARYLKDNRLLPEGADKAKLPPDIAVYGEAAADSNFTGGSDKITYQVDVTGAQGPFTIQAELLYMPLSYRFVQDLLADQTPLTGRFGGYYQKASKTPLVVTTISSTTTR